MAIVTASDGVTLAVRRYTDIDPTRPTVLAIHGFPDNHRLWDGIAAMLGRRYNFVAYDVRGAGESSCPATRSGYRLEQLVSDIGDVIDSLGAGQVHLLAHDWGSVQAWAAVTDARVRDKVGSFTSISGPHLHHAGAFLRSARTARTTWQVARQVASSGYIGLLLCPGVPDLAFRWGVGGKIVAAFERVGRSGVVGRLAAASRSIDDHINGLNLYRENLPGPLLSPGGNLPRTEVAVQVLAPSRDLFITPALQRFIGSIPLHGRVVAVDGGHWVVVSHPDVVARLTGEWIDRVCASRNFAGVRT